MSGGRPRMQVGYRCLMALVAFSSVALLATRSAGAALLAQQQTATGAAVGSEVSEVPCPQSARRGSLLQSQPAEGSGSGLGTVRGTVVDVDGAGVPGAQTGGFAPFWRSSSA